MRIRYSVCIAGQYNFLTAIRRVCHTPHTNILAHTISHEWAAIGPSVFQHQERAQQCTSGSHSPPAQPRPGPGTAPGAHRGAVLGGRRGTADSAPHHYRGAAHGSICTSPCHIQHQRERIFLRVKCGPAYLRKVDTKGAVAASGLFSPEAVDSIVEQCMVHEAERYQRTSKEKKKQQPKNDHKGGTLRPWCRPCADRQGHT